MANKLYRMVNQLTNILKNKPTLVWILESRDQNYQKTENSSLLVAKNNGPTAVVHLICATAKTLSHYYMYLVCSVLFFIIDVCFPNLTKAVLYSFLQQLLIFRPPFWFYQQFKH